MAKIKTVERFRVKPRWLFVKITDDEGNVGWGEGTLEGHDLAVEGAIDEIIVRIKGLEARSVQYEKQYKILALADLLVSNIEHIWQP